MRAVALLAVAAAAETELQLRWQDASYGYEEFVRDFRGGSAPAAPERQRREKVFLSNLAAIRAHNAGDSTHRLGVNKFADWTEEEFSVMRAGRRHAGSAGPIDPKKHWGQCTAAATSTAAIPDAVDWRSNSSIVTAPKDQGGCGSCWAFSTVETVESHVAIETGKLLKLSEQQVVSCAPNPDHCGGTGGCQGSTQELGFSYVIGNPLATEKSYKYSGSTGKCTSSKIVPAAGIKGCEVLPANDGDALARAVAARGPIAISVAASGIAWQLYSGGVVSSCDTAIDHAVQLVGYTAKYWIVRNSWGASWGEKGYILLKRQPGNEQCGTDKSPADGSACKGETGTMKVCGTCGVLSDSSYPTGGYIP